jgi:cysteine desulfurase
MRSGTENVSAIAGFSEALKITSKIKETESKRLKDLRDYFIKLLEGSNLNYFINGSVKNRLPNNLNLSFVGQDNEMMLYKLDQEGVMCSTGSACSAQKNTISPTLLAIGLNEVESLSSLRFSLGRKTTKKQIDYTVKTLQKILS